MLRPALCGLAALLSLAAPSLALAQKVITTVAGSEIIFPKQSRALEAPLDEITCAVADGQGNVYVCDIGNHIVSRVSADGTLTVVAGNGIREGGFSGDGGSATSASLYYPTDVAIDSAGNLYIADTGNNRIRKVSPLGIISTVAGNGNWDFSGDGGAALNAALKDPSGVAVDTAGNLYIADRRNYRIRKVDPQGIISTIAGDGRARFFGDGGPATSGSLDQPRALAVDPGGNLYIADSGNNRIRKVNPQGTITTVAGTGSSGFSGDGGPATSAALDGPAGVALDAIGNLYIADRDNKRIRKVSPQGIITTVAGNGQFVFSGDGGPATAASLNYPESSTVDAAGNLYIADTDNHRLRRVNLQGIISTYAGSGLPNFFGDGGPATSASLDAPTGVGVDAVGNLYIADRDNHRIRKITPAGVISSVAGNGLPGFSGDGGPATSASLNTPLGVAADVAGNLYIVDGFNDRIRKVNPQGIISTLAGTGQTGFSGDGGPATSAMLNSPEQVAVDAAGNVYFSDRLNDRVRKVSPGGIISTVAGGNFGFGGDGGPATSARLQDPIGVAVDLAGNLYIADASNQRIRKVTPQGTISTLAGTGDKGYSGDGGAAATASMNVPVGVAADAAGNVYVADKDNHRIRRVSPLGIISTVAGNGQKGFFGDGGVATGASLNFPFGVAVDASGNIYIADRGNERIRAVLSRPAAFSVTPNSLSFTAPAGSASVAPRQLTLSSNFGAAGLAWETAAVITGSGGSWLSVSPTSGQMPAAVTVFVDATNLAPGVYQGQIDISAPAAPVVQTVTVTFTVTAAQQPGLSVQPAELSFQALAGATAQAVPAQSLRIANSGAGTLNWTAQAATLGGGNWLAISPGVGAVSAAAPGSLQVSVNPAGLAAGSYSGSVTVRSATTSQSVTAPVILRVGTPSAELLLSQSNLLFRAVEAGGFEPAQTFGVLNIGSGAVDWTAQSSVPWLRISPSGGRSEAGATKIPQVTVSVEPVGLTAGFYVGLIQVSAEAANNSPQLLRVDLQVLPRGTKLGAVVRPTGLIFVATGGGSSPGSQEVGVATPEQTPVEFISQPIGGDWILRAPESATASRDNPGRIVVQPQLRSLAPGVYRAGLTVLMKDDGSLHPVSLLFLVLSPATAAPSAFGGDGPDIAQAAADCTPSQVLLQFTSLFANFNATVGWPTTVLVNARDNCGNPAVGGTVSLSFSSGDPALALTDLKNGQYQGVWRPNSTAGQPVVVTARALWRGLQGQSASTAQVGANPNPQGAILSQGGVLLGAGFGRGPLAPGSIISLFGRNLASGDNFATSLPLPRTLGGVRVLIGGKEAPLFYVGPGQVNAQVPLDLAADRQLQVLVESKGVPSAPEPLQTAANRPGIFTLGPPFGDQGAILIANTDRLAMPVTANVPSEPVPIGGIISIFCTGLGATDPALPSGTPGPADPPALVKTPVAVIIGGQPAAVSFAGLAPGLVGVYQVNARVPAEVTPGDAVPVVLTQGGFQSNTATIAVR